jgi:3,2-trans-enoyl-CoA isomerase
MFSLRRAVAGRTAVAVTACAGVRCQGGRHGGGQHGGDRGGRRGGQGGSGMSRQDQEAMFRQQQQMQQMQQMQRGGGGAPPQRGAPQEMRRGGQAPPQQQQMEEEPEEDATPPPPPTKPENSQFVKVEQRPDGAAVMRMARAPVNSLNLEMFTELADWFMWLSTEESGCKSVVLTSDIATVFSAGLDINELHKPEQERFEKFWMSFQEIWLIINSFPKPVIAGINGNSPAGGCVIALCCDYRVMARASLKDPANPKAYRIGLNETKLGIIAPPWVMKSLAYVVGERKAEKMLQLGETPTADEALAMGLIDRVVEEGELLEAAAQEAAKFAAIPGEARWMSKDMMRRELMQFFPSEQERIYDMEFFSSLVQNPEVVDNVGKYLARLAGGKKKQQ